MGVFWLIVLFLMDYCVVFDYFCFVVFVFVVLICVGCCQCVLFYVGGMVVMVVILFVSGLMLYMMVCEVIQVCYMMFVVCQFFVQIEFKMCMMGMDMFVMYDEVVWNLCVIDFVCVVVFVVGYG